MICKDALLNWIVTKFVSKWCADSSERSVQKRQAALQNGMPRDKFIEKKHFEFIGNAGIKAVMQSQNGTCLI